MGLRKESTVDTGIVIFLCGYAEARTTRKPMANYSLPYALCEDIQDMDLTQALQSLLALFAEHVNSFAADITSVVRCKVTEWMNSQALFIQALFENIRWGS